MTCDTAAGGLVGINIGTLEGSYSTANVTGVHEIGGLVGRNNSDIINCYSTGSVTGERTVGGLVGIVYIPVNIANCSSDGDVIGVEYIGGLIGDCNGILTNCYSTASVSGERFVGGLVGIIDQLATTFNCYSTGSVDGITETGGLMGGGYYNANVLGSFWDIESSGQTTSFRGTGMNTAGMQTAATFLEAGWDFFDETINGNDDIWWIDEDPDYPRLWWESSE